MPKLEIQIAGTWRDSSWDREQRKKKRIEMPVTTKLLSKEDADRIFNSRDFGRFNKEVKNV
jgi:hypothetical protein